MDYLAAETTRPVLRDKADLNFFGSKALKPVSIQSVI